MLAQGVQGDGSVLISFKDCLCCSIPVWTGVKPRGRNFSILQAVKNKFNLISKRQNILIPLQLTEEEKFLRSDSPSALSDGQAEGAGFSLSPW